MLAREPSAASGFLLLWPASSLSGPAPAAFAVRVLAMGGASGSPGASFCFDFRQVVILFTNVQGQLTGCSAPESPDGLWVSPEAATMSLYQLGILWAGDQNPCPALARGGAGREVSSLLGSD